MNIVISDQVIYEKFGNIQNLMYLLGEQNFRNGFPYYNQNYRKRRLLFNPIIRNIFYVLYLMKDITSYFITHEYYAVLSGDWFYDYLFKFQMTLSMTIPVCMNMAVDITNHLFLKNNKTLKSVISNEYNERIPTANKMKHIFSSFERLFTYSIYFFGSCLSALFLSRFCTLDQMLTYGSFWILIMAQFAVYVIPHFFWNLLFFVSFC